MPATTLWRLVVDGETIEETTQFTYNSDILAVGEECRWMVVNDRGRYIGKLLDGSVAEVYAINQDVLGGKETLKFKGRIVERKARVNAQAYSLIELGIYDLGWHLVNCRAPLWFKLDKANTVDLADPSKFVVGKNGKKGYFLDPSFGFTGFRTDGLAKRRVKLGLAVANAAQQKVLDPVFYVQVEPGDTLYKRIVELAKRENRLVNVSPTGEMQLFLPDYTQAPLYQFRLREGDSSNNIIDAEEIQSCATKWTEVEVVGQQFGWEGAKDSTDPNATKKRGGVKHPELLPFLNRLTAADGDMYQRGLAQKMADWLYKRGLYDAYALRITVSGHHQNGNWYEADTMSNVDIEPLGVSGPMYVAAVKYTVDEKGGDIAVLTLRRPGLLTASFGVYPQPPIIKSLRDPKTQPQQEQKT